MIMSDKLNQLLARFKALTTDKVTASRELSPELRKNIDWNKKQWGDKKKWAKLHKYGYQWSGGYKQDFNEMTFIAERFLLPYIGKRRDLTILEVAPGAGRFTTELIRLAKELYLLDMNEACIKLCRERFKYYSNISYFVNDGVSCQMIPSSKCDLIATYDSFVHVEAHIIRFYLQQFVKKLVPDGIVWIDHSGKGAREKGKRTAMTDKLMRQFADELSLQVIAQEYRNDHDCISILRKETT